MIIRLTKHLVFIVFHILSSMKDGASDFFPITRKYRDKTNKRGANIEISDIKEFGSHNIASNPIIVGGFRYKERSCSLSLATKTIGAFCDNHNPNIH